MDAPTEPTPLTAPTPVDIRATEPALLGERLSPRVVGHWYVTDLVRAAIAMAVLVFGVETFAREAGSSAPAWLPTAGYVLAAVLLALTLIWPPLAFRAWRFSVDDDLLAMHYGVLFVEERRIPVPRLQHVDLVRGPIERLFGLATLVVFTAGNEGSAFRVPGLRVARAEALRDGILRARGRDGI